MWKQQTINTKRGTFELLLKAVANRFALHITIPNLMRLVITLRMFSLLRIVYCSLIYEALVTQQKPVENELSMIETIHDLEAIQETLQLPTWHFAGHSTGGMLGLLYAITYPKSLQSLVVVGAAASNYTETPFCIYHPEHPQFHYMQQLIENLKALTLQMRNEKNYLPNEQNYLYINPKTTILILINQSKQCPLAG